MLPPAAASELRARRHDALSIVDAKLEGAADENIYELAVAQGRVVVTENFADFVNIGEERRARDEPCVPVVFVRKRDLPRGRALASRLARDLDRWAADNPDPYPGPHWL